MGDLLEVGREENFGLTTDGACEADRPEGEKKNKKYIPTCAGTTTPSIHPFKKPEAYMKCLEAAAGFCVNAVLGASPILPRRKLLGIANSAWRRLLTSPWRQVAAFFPESMQPARSCPRNRVSHSCLA